MSLITRLATVPAFVLFASLTLGTASGWAAPPPVPEILEGLFAKVVLGSTEAGTGYVGRVTGNYAGRGQVLSESAFESLGQRWRWVENTELRYTTADMLEVAQKDFLAQAKELGFAGSFEDFAKIYRRDLFSAEELAAAKLPNLSRQELSALEGALEKAAEKAFSNATMDNLIIKAGTYYSMRNSQAVARQKFRQGASMSEGTPEEAAAFLSEAPIETVRKNRAAAAKGGGTSSTSSGTGGPSEASGGDLNDLRLRWYGRLAIYTRGLGNLAKSLILSEAQFKTIFGLAGREFTSADLLLARRWAEMINAVPLYEQARIKLVEMFRERPSLYVQRNKLTEAALRDHQSGTITDAALMKARAKVTEELGMEKIVDAGEQEMLDTLSKLRDLGGGIKSGQNQKGELNTLLNRKGDIQAKIKGFEDLVAANKKTLAANETALGNAKKAQNAKATLTKKQLEDLKTLPGQIKELAAATRALENQIGKERLTLDDVARNLQDKYASFVEAWDHLSLSVNARNGYVGEDQVQIFAIPDNFMPERWELMRWKDLVDRAVHESAQELTLRTYKGIIRAKFGQTKQFVRQMNEWTGKVSGGPKFTESEAGKKFKAHAKNWVFANLKTISTTVLGGGAVAKHFDIDKLLMDKADSAIEGLFSTFGGSSSRDESGHKGKPDPNSSQSGQGGSDPAADPNQNMSVPGPAPGPTMSAGTPPAPTTNLPPANPFGDSPTDSTAP